MRLRLVPGLLVFGILGACGGPPATIEFERIDPKTPRIGEIATLTFVLKDYRGVPQAGTEVNFRLATNTPGVMLSPSSTVSLKGSGEAQVQVVSSIGVTSITVVADAGGGKVALSPPISFAGSNIPSASQFTFQCGEIAGAASGGIHALGAFDSSRNLIAGLKLKCTAHLADRRGDAVVGGIVSFLTEAGALEPGSTSSSDVVGNATIQYKTSLPLPHPTDPGTFTWDPNASCTASDKTFCNGEYLVPLWMEPFTWTTNPLATYLTGSPMFNPTTLPEPRRDDPIRKSPTGAKIKNNPRDNLVAMIAVTAGEEAFVDSNDNGIHDDMEPFTDLTEPFVDANDNGTWDTDETYIDTNGNGQWDGQNGMWDSSTQIWREERILWTGIPYAALYPLNTGLNEPDDYTGAEPVVKSGQPGAPPVIKCRGGAYFTFVIADPWFNSIARNGEGDGCQQGASTDNVKVNSIAGSSGIAFTYPPIRAYTYQVVDNNNRDPGMGTNPPSPSCYPPPYTGTGTGSTPQEFSVAVKCVFTAAQESGQVTGIPDFVTGQVYNNLPGVAP